MTDRLYYHDSYLTEFRARVVETSPDRLRIYLDRTAFYPTSGGQPFDIGKLGAVNVREVVDEDGRIAHQISAPLEAGPPSSTKRGCILAVCNKGSVAKSASCSCIGSRS